MFVIVGFGPCVSPKAGSPLVSARAAEVLPPRLGEILGRSEGGVNSRPVKDIAAKCPFANIYYIW